MSSLFLKIVRGELPCYKVAENNNYLAFLDVRPLKKGHTLVIPKKEVDYLFDLDDTLYAGLMVFAKKVAKSIEQVIPCKRIGVVVIGLEVPHAHVHLIPIDEVYDIDFSKQRVKLTDVQFIEIAEKIYAQFIRNKS